MNWAYLSNRSHWADLICLCRLKSHEVMIVIDRVRESHRWDVDSNLLTVFWGLTWGYKIIQHPWLSFVGRQFISRTISMKTSLTLCVLRAEASRKGQPQNEANDAPSLVPTSLWCPRSHLLPTSNIGTLSVPFTRTIWSFIVLMSWKVCRLVML